MKREEKVINYIDADYGFPSRVKSDQLGMLLSDRHVWEYALKLSGIADVGKVESLLDTHKKIRNQRNRFRIFTHQEDRSMDP